MADDSVTLEIPQDTVEVAEGIEGGGASSCASTTTACGLQWDLARIHVPEAWNTTMGSPSVKVAVLDTGLNSRHEEVGPNYDVAESKSFVQSSSFCAADNDTFNSIEDFKLGAFGVGCTSCYAFIQGTSMATPQVAGVAALALAAHPGMTPNALVRLLQRSVTSFADPNATPAISNDPGSPQFNYDIAYGTDGVSNELMGTGVIDAGLGVR